MNRELIIIDGADVDPWLEGLYFEYSDGSVRVSEESKEKFDSFDQAMWLEWVQRYVEERQDEQ